MTSFAETTKNNLPEPITRSEKTLQRKTSRSPKQVTHYFHFDTPANNGGFSCL